MDLISLFKEKAAEMSAQVVEVNNLSEAFDYAVTLCERKDFCELLLSGCGETLSDAATTHCLQATSKIIAAPELDEEDFALLQGKVQEKGVEIIRSGMRDHLGGVDLALSPAMFGIAETATVAVASDNEEMRLATMLAEVHVVILQASQLIATVEESDQQLDAVLQAGQPSYTAFITGPSRTADIERELSLGVHGPLELHIALVGGA